MTCVPRRRLLRGLSFSAVVGSLMLATRRIRSAGAESTPESASGLEFDPTVHGFGFENFSTPLVAPEPDEFVSTDEIRAGLAARLDDAIPNRSGLSMAGGLDTQLNAIVEELLTNASRLFGTDGYCYGMAVTARRYFDDPESIPVDRAPASEITDVNAPADEPSTPVREEIERYQRAQFTDVDSWLRRWPLLRPSRIDYRAQARTLCGAIDEDGTAGVTLTGENVLAGHYVLLCGYDVTETDVTFEVYDPNDDAAAHAEAGGRTLGIDTTSDEPVFGSYADEYDRFLYSPVNRDGERHPNSN